MIASALILLGCVAAPRPTPPSGSADARASDTPPAPAVGWRSVGPLLDLRSGVRLQDAAILGDGRLVTVGGGKNDYQVFDPVTGAADRVATPWTDDLLLDASVASLGDGRLLTLGSAPLGAGRWVHKCVILDPVKQLAWQELGCPATWETGGDPSAVLVDEGVFAYDGSNVPALLDRDRLTWTIVGRPPENTNGSSQLIALDGHRVLASGSGGSVGFVLDLHSRAYTRTAPIPRPRSGFVMVESGGDAVFVGGGSATAPDDRVDRYDPESDTWFELPPLRHARCNHEALSLPDGSIVVVGGWDEHLARVAEAEILRPGATAWEPAGTLVEPRTDPVAVEMNGRVLLLGGSGSDGVRAEGSFTLTFEPVDVVEMATGL